MPSRAGVKLRSSESRGRSLSTLKHLSLQTSDVQMPSLQCGQDDFCFSAGEDRFAFMPGQSGMWSLLTACSIEASAGIAEYEASGATAMQSARSTETIFLQACIVRLAKGEVSAPELGRSRWRFVVKAYRGSSRPAGNRSFKRPRSVQQRSPKPKEQISDWNAQSRPSVLPPSFVVHQDRRWQSRVARNG